VKTVLKSVDFFYEITSIIYWLLFMARDVYTTLCSKKNWTTKLMAVTLLNLNPIFKTLSLLDSVINLQ